MNYLKYLKDNIGAFGLLAGIILVITGGTMSIIGVYVNYIVYDTVRWTTPVAGESFGIASSAPWNDGNLTGTAANIPIQPNSETLYCNSTAIDDNTSYYTLVDLTGVLAVNTTDCINDTVTMDYVYAGVTSMTTIYGRVANAFLILSVALIVIGAAVIFRALYMMRQS